MKWATRPSIHVDRAATAWLIARHIDPDAEFVYIDDPADVPGDAIAFDMRGVELTHRGGDVTFETVLKVHQLDDPVLGRIAEIVHEADVDDDRFHAPEAAGLDAIIRGLSQIHDDERVRSITDEMFDGLYSLLS